MNPNEIQKKINKLIETKSYEILSMFLNKGLELNKNQIDKLFNINENDLQDMVEYQNIINITPNNIYEKYLFNIVKYEQYNEIFLNKLTDDNFKNLMFNKIFEELDNLIKNTKITKFKKMVDFMIPLDWSNGYSNEYLIYNKLNQINYYINKYKENFIFKEEQCEILLLKINKIENINIYNHFSREINNLANNISTTINSMYKNLQLKLINDLPIYNIDIKLKNILNDDKINDKIKEKIKEIIDLNEYINKNNILLTAEQKNIIENIELRVPDIIKNYLDIDKTIKNKENTDEIINKTLDNIIETIKSVSYNINEDKLKNISIDFRYSENIKKEYGTRYK